MRRLLKIAFGKSQNRILIGITLLAMVLATFSSQLEMFAIGMITKKGPDFFELFAKEQEGKFIKEDKISFEDVEKRWQEIDLESKGMITTQDTNRYLQTRKSTDIIQKGINLFNSIFPINDNLTHLAFFLVLIATFRAITLFAHRFCVKLIAISVSKDLRREYFQHIQTLPMAFYQQHPIGALSSRVVGDAALIAEAVNACLVNYFQTPFTVLSTLSLCFMASWQLSVIIFAGIPLIVFPIVVLSKKVKKISKQIQQNQEKFASVIIDFLAGIQTVKMFAMEEFALKKYCEQNDKMASLEQKSARYDLSTRPIIHTIAMFCLATALIYGLYILKMSVPEVLFFCGLLYIFYEPVKKFAEENTHIQRGIAAADRMFEVLDLKPQIQDQVKAEDLEGFNDTLEFEDVWFKYNEQWVLKGLSFKVKKGETIAIVGPTGAGKSTIVQLLPRLYDIQKGAIRIDGKSIHSLSQRSLRENISFVPQRPFLFLDSIAENISYGNKLPLEEIQEAAKRAHAHEFISKLPLGYDTILDESGKNLSGGQQQRLAIARALLKKAPILVMDEATSSLDNISESHIKSAIKQLQGKITQIIIAHRLSTIEHADRIIYLENGQKIAEGSKDELLASCAGFKQMWEIMRSK